MAKEATYDRILDCGDKGFRGEGATRMRLRWMRRGRGSMR